MTPQTPEAPRGSGCGRAPPSLRRYPEEPSSTTYPIELTEKDGHNSTNSASSDMKPSYLVSKGP